MTDGIGPAMKQDHDGGRGNARPALGERMARAAAVFLDPRVLIILLLGFSSGLPLALSGSTLFCG